jgi:hypothetical protein
VVSLGGRQCRTYTAVTASFRVLTASLSGMSIYTHPTPPGHAADLQTIKDTSKALLELSPTLSL